MAICFFIGHRDTLPSILPKLREAVERHIADYGVTEFIVGRYGSFDSLAAQVVKEAKQRHPEIRLTLLPYYDPIKPLELLSGFDGFPLSRWPGARSKKGCYCPSQSIHGLP